MLPLCLRKVARNSFLEVHEKQCFEKQYFEKQYFEKPCTHACHANLNLK